MENIGDVKRQQEEMDRLWGWRRPSALVLKPSHGASELVSEARLGHHTWK